MKKIRNSFDISALFLSLTLFTSFPVQAKTLSVTPTVLRKTIAQSNHSVLQGMNDLQKAKTQVWLARTQLLPSINFGGVLESAASGSFVSATVSVLLPFLLPSNWFNLKESKELLKSQTLSFDLVLLNQYATAYSLYATVIEDEGLLGILKSQTATYAKIQAIIEERYEVGLATYQELIQSRAQTQLGRSQESQMTALLAKERATLRQILGLSVSQDFSLDARDVPPSASESTGLSTLLNAAFEKSPERQQINYLITAGKAEKWKRIFGFFTGSSVSTHFGSGQTAFSSFTQSANMNLGFSTIPTVALSQQEVNGLGLRMSEIKQEQGRILESTLASIREAKAQTAQSSQAEKNLKEAFEIEVQKYESGLTDLLHVYQMQNSVVQASTTRVKSISDLNQQRIQLHRVLIADQFGQLPKCRNTLDKVKNVTLDQICK